MNSHIQIHLKHRFLHLLHQEPSLLSPQHLLQIHSHLITTGFHSDQSLLLLLFHLCALKPSLLDHSTLIFDKIHQPDVVVWRVLIRGHASGSNPIHSLHLFRNLQRRGDGEEPIPSLEPFIFASAIKACGRIPAIREGKSIHCQVLRLGLDSNLNIKNTLIHFYSNSVNSLIRACNLFYGSSCRTIVTVNCMISGFLKNKLFDMGLRLFSKILIGSLGEELRPNDVTLVILISGCSEFGNLGIGRSLHGYCYKSVMVCRISVCNALIDLYSKFGCMDLAEQLFREMPERDLVSWNSLIMGHGRNSDAERAISLYRAMRSNSIEGDKVTLVSVISACARGKNLEMGKWIHSHLKRRVKAFPVSIVTALIKMYSKCGLTETAREVFDEMYCRNIVSWNTMILAYAENGFLDEALSLFDQLQSEKLVPDEVTILGLILACRNYGVFDHVDRIHSYVQSSGLEGKMVLCNALIDMYAKFGCMDRAKRIFDKMFDRDVISWTSMIVGHAINGEGREALGIFSQMRVERVEPNSITFIGVLSACGHTGLVDDGRNLYEIMCREYRINPEIRHCGCMVDMLARAGLLEEAHEFVKSMPIEPNAVIWRMLIGACRVHGDIGLGVNLVDGLLELKQFCDPEDYVISSHVFATAGRWDDVLLARRLIADKKFLKTPGKSSISGATA